MVKVRTDGQSQGSFGIPEALQPQERGKVPSSPSEARAAANDEAYRQDGLAEEVEEEEVRSEAELILEGLGITITDEELLRFLLSEPLEKEVVIIKNKLKATFRSLIVSDIREIEDIMGNDINEIKMTSVGAEGRRQMLQLSYGVTHMLNRPLANKKSEGGQPLPNKELAEQRLVHIAKMSPQVFNIILEKYSAFQIALNLLSRDTETHLKK